MVAVEGAVRRVVTAAPALVHGRAVLAWGFDTARLPYDLGELEVGRPAPSMSMCASMFGVLHHLLLLSVYTQRFTPY